VEGAFFRTGKTTKGLFSALAKRRRGFFPHWQIDEGAFFRTGKNWWKGLFSEGLFSGNQSI
jgi:hypothetical protein